jgi:hypothetical protein
MTDDLRLDAAAYLVDDLGARDARETHDVEGVEDGDRAGQSVADGVGVATERVQRGVLDADRKVGRLGLEPAGVGGARPPGTTSSNRACRSRRPPDRVIVRGAVMLISARLQLWLQFGR